MKIETLGEFLEFRVQPKHRGIVAWLRKFMREAAPGSREVITYGILAWRANAIFAVVSPTRKDVTLAFSRGAKFADKYHLLQGKGQISKHVKIRDVHEVNAEALKYYVKQALKLDARAGKAR